MKGDIRGDDLYKQVEEFYRRALEPGFGRPTDADELAVAPDGKSVAFTGTFWESLESKPKSRVCLADLQSGELESVTTGPHDRMPAWAPDGSLAFLSDRRREGTAEAFVQPAGRVGDPVAVDGMEGVAESVSWSPDGRCLLIGVAGRGAELAGVQGSGRTAERTDAPSWLPEVKSTSVHDDWRRAWVYRCASRSAVPVSPEGLNVWECSWAGNDKLVAIVSGHPGEGSWYDARLVAIHIDGGAVETLLTSDVQLGWPSASPSGDRIAVLEAVCSDRMVVAGDLLVLSPGGEPQRIETAGVDVTHAHWRDEDHLLYSGLRDLSTVVAEYDATKEAVSERWVNGESCGAFYPAAWPVGNENAIFVAHAPGRPPRLSIARPNEDVVDLVSFAHDGIEYLANAGGSSRRMSWPGPDGIEIQGFWYTPAGAGPHPLILEVHGGPVSAYTARHRSFLVPLLVARGFAVLCPNPRGSTGRGRDFAAKVVGDMGGADAGDLLAGVDFAVSQGIADPDRLGVMGVSYGGFMTAWLVTQSNRFSAAVAASPVTNWYSQHNASNIGHWDQLFLCDDPTAAGEYIKRSPVMFAANATTPTLLTAGAKDRCTPPGQAVEFFGALEAAGVEAELVLYPEEGHGVDDFPAAIDYSARCLGWFERHLRAPQG